MARGQPPGRDYMWPGRRVTGRDYMQPPEQNGVESEARRSGPPPGGDEAVAGSPRGNGVTDTARRSGQAATLLDAPATANGGAPPADARPAVAAAGGGPPPARGGPFAVFALHDFRYLTLSTIAVGFGQWAQQIGIFWLIFDMTGSAVQLGLLAATRGIVGMAIAPLGGLLAEKYPRRDVMIWSTVAGALQAAVLATLVISDIVVVWHVYAFALIAGTTMSINQPTRQALVADVTTDELLPNAVAMNSAAQNISRVAGPPLAGVLIGFFGVAAPFIFIVAARSLAVALTLPISRVTRQERLTHSRGALRDMFEGFGYSWRDKRILGLIVVGAIPSLLVYPYIAFVLVMAKDVLDQGAQGFGMLSAMLGWGSIAGLLLLAYAGRRLTRGWIMLACFTIYAALLILFASSTVYVWSLAILAIAGIFHSIAMALNNTLLQLAVRNDLRGRVMAVWQMSHGLQPLGSLPMGLLVASQGPQIGIGAFMVVATVLFIIVGLTWGSVRRM